MQSQLLQRSVKPGSLGKLTPCKPSPSLLCRHHAALVAGSWCCRSLWTDADPCFMAVQNPGCLQCRSD